MSNSAREIIIRFAKYAGQPHGWEPDGKNGRLRHRFPDGSRCSLYYGRTFPKGRITEIQSYGSHFPLAQLALNEDGTRRLWVLNGDRWGGGGWSRTNEQNEMMREAAQKSGTPWIILPFSALREAGIKTGTIVPVDMQPERWTREEHASATLAGVPEQHRKRDVRRDATGRVVTPPVTDDGRQASDDGNGFWHAQRHSALDGWTRTPVSGPAYTAPLDWAREEITPGEDGLYHWQEERHWLGESVFTATRESWNRDDGSVMRTGSYLSAFDTNEPAPLYFLAELPPGAWPRTVARARQALKPPQVVLAERHGNTVLRQGDVFAIPTGLETRMLPGPSQRTALVLGVNHRATEVRVMEDETYARGFLRHSRVPREHVTIRLGDGKTWHRLVKNTVPEGRSWSMAGNVD